MTWIIFLKRTTWTAITAQSYDNTSSMRRKCNGLQALVLEENNLAVSVPCAGHSFNVVVWAIKLTQNDCTEYDSETKLKSRTNIHLAPLDCVQAPKVDLTPSDKFQTQSFIPVIDELESASRKRLEAYKLVNTHFGFLNQLDTLSN